MTRTKLQRRAVIWRGEDGWWTVNLHAEGLFIGTLSWPTHPEAVAAALRWTGLG
jgi:hypothetical protein